MVKTAVHLRTRRYSHWGTNVSNTTRDVTDTTRGVPRFAGSSEAASWPRNPAAAAELNPLFGNAGTRKSLSSESQRIMFAALKVKFATCTYNGW